MAATQVIKLEAHFWVVDKLLSLESQAEARLMLEEHRDRLEAMALEDLVLIPISGDEARALDWLDVLWHDLQGHASACDWSRSPLATIDCAAVGGLELPETLPLSEERLERIHEMVHEVLSAQSHAQMARSVCAALEPLWERLELFFALRRGEPKLLVEEAGQIEDVPKSRRQV